MDVVCYYRIASDYVAESGNVRTTQLEKVRPTPRTKYGKRNETKKVWRKR